MGNAMNKIILYIATSLDGFIADINGGVDWLPHPKDDAELEAVGYKSLMSHIDTILMGSRSYKQILGFGDWGWPDKQTYVFTSKQLETDKPYISITHNSPLEFMASLKDRKSDKDIWLLGGSELVKNFAQEGLIDEVILTIVPQTLAAGIPLGLSFENFNLTAEKALTDGMIQKTYLRGRNYESQT
ncbi:MAG: hypothetical protein K0R73_323 [Candidatus Midichloriaceae bacterium]|nr:hypothetical protein [Candidatus Midichloriaceae bacterium]